MTLIHDVVRTLIEAKAPLTSDQVVQKLKTKGPSTSAALWIAVRRGWISASHKSTSSHPATFTPNVKSVDSIPASPWAGSRKKQRRTQVARPAATGVGAKLAITITVNGRDVELTLAEANKIHSDLTTILDVSTRP